MDAVLLIVAILTVYWLVLPVFYRLYLKRAGAKEADTEKCPPHKWEWQYINGENESAGTFLECKKCKERPNYNWKSGSVY